jgi:hypothetical protein
MLCPLFFNMLTIQYLENKPRISNLNPQQVVEKLRKAGELLPITHVLIGWQVPEKLLDACRKESDRMGATFMRWHPLLTGDGIFKPNPRWQVISLSGQRVKGYQNLQEFTHVCPNNPEAAQANLRHLDQVIKSGTYQGLFLDRVRYPSPTIQLPNSLGCFCVHCKTLASSYGFSLNEVQQLISGMLVDEAGAVNLVRALFGRYEHLNSSACDLLTRFFFFRYESITRFTAAVSKELRQAGMEIGLDCFSPCLAYLVGQNLEMLGKSTDWIKIMSYAHTYGPAGIPYELSGLWGTLITTFGLEEKDAMVLLNEVTGLSLPESRALLEKEGISSQALFKEVERGVSATASPVLAGFELVGDKKAAHLSASKMEANLKAIIKANPRGIAISWDLLKITDEKLELFARVYHTLWSSTEK